MSRLTKEYKNLNSFRDRHGKTRHYYRVPGKKAIAVAGEFGSHEFDANYEAAKTACADIADPLPGQKSIIKGTVHDLCARYYESYEFKHLKPRTRQRYREQIERFRTGVGHVMVRAITPAHLNKVKAAYADRPGAGRTLLKRLRTLFNFGVSEGFRGDNPAARVKLPKEGNGFLPWSDYDIESYKAKWGPGTPERLGLYLCLYTAQRRSDIVKMGLQHVRDGEISVVQEKTGTRVWIPLHSELRAEIARMPAGQMMFAYSPKTRKARTSEGFGNWIRQNAKEAGIDGTRGPHGLRKAACRTLIELGVDSDTAIGISGHKSTKELEPYIRDVNRRKKAQQAMAVWDSTG
ncbi:tyrosine-type recombinase/integrase [Asticcacaulis solisilvae]|uniref:tyrosine-type recombinase/integrase n=1 Tax=Asticcacaulis solisilvae TaxID=1217274 RepID=UPI003FD84A6E